MTVLYIFSALAFMMLICSIISKEERAENFIIALATLAFGVFLARLK